MNLTPTRPAFRELSRSRQCVPIAARLPLDAPVQALFEALDFGTPRILLESARTHPVTGRYSIAVGRPSFKLTAKGSAIRIARPDRVEALEGNPFLILEKLLASRRALRLPFLPPFVGGAVGFIGFDACRLLESLPSRAKDDLAMPDFGFLFCDEAVVVDHEEQALWVLTLAPPGGQPDRAYDRAVGRIEEWVGRIAGTGTVRTFAAVQGPPAAGDRSWSDDERVLCTHSRASFEAMVRRAKGFIADGEVYQANLSQRLSLRLSEEPWALYRQLTESNPSPFAAFADFGFLQIVSASPERLLRVSGGIAETRPLAGTRPRGGSAEETARLRRELILNEKERAEHLMLVDLERNDLGRVCRYGSVRVDDLMALEEYSHVIHIVSNVRGEPRPGTSLQDLLGAVFPGGTISGCPKIRCLQIIDALEPVRRQLYTGALGYVSFSGEMDFNLLIRTAFVHQGWVHVQAGAGIVADSDPGREYEETLHKAQALLDVCLAETV